MAGRVPRDVARGRSACQRSRQGCPPGQSPLSIATGRAAGFALSCPRLPAGRGAPLLGRPRPSRAGSERRRWARARGGGAWHSPRRGRRARPCSQLRPQERPTAGPRARDGAPQRPASAVLGATSAGGGREWGGAPGMWFSARRELQPLSPRGAPCIAPAGSADGPPDSRGSPAAVQTPSQRGWGVGCRCFCPLDCSGAGRGGDPPAPRAKRSAPGGSCAPERAMCGGERAAPVLFHSRAPRRSSRALPSSSLVGTGEASPGRGRLGRRAGGGGGRQPHAGVQAAETGQSQTGRAAQGTRPRRRAPTGPQRGAEPGAGPTCLRWGGSSAARGRQPRLRAPAPARPTQEQVPGRSAQLAPRQGWGLGLTGTKAAAVTRARAQGMSGGLLLSRHTLSWKAAPLPSQPSCALHTGHN